MKNKKRGLSSPKSSATRSPATRDECSPTKPMQSYRAAVNQTEDNSLDIGNQSTKSSNDTFNTVCTYFIALQKWLCLHRLLTPFVIFANHDNNVVLLSF